MSVIGRSDGSPDFSPILPPKAETPHVAGDQSQEKELDSNQKIRFDHLVKIILRRKDDFIRGGLNEIENSQNPEQLKNNIFKFLKVDNFVKKAITDDITNLSVALFTNNSKLLKTIPLIVENNQKSLEITERSKKLEDFLKDPNFEVKAASIPPQRIIQMLDSLGGGILDLLAIQPKYALGILNNPNVKLPNHFFEYLADDFAKFPVIITKEKDKDVAACLSVLFKNPAVNQKDFIDKVLTPLIKMDLPECAWAVLDTPLKTDTDKLAFVNVALEWDSLECFKKLYHLWPASGYDMLLDMAADKGAVRCLEYCVENRGISESQKKKIAEKAAKEGDAEMILAVCKNDPDKIVKAGKYLFSQISPLDTEESHNQLINILKKVFRFSSLSNSKAVIEAYIKGINSSSEQKAFQEIYAQTLAKYLQIAPFVARYKKQSDLADIQKVYLTSKPRHDIAQQDFEYGEYCFTQVDDMVWLYRYGMFKAPWKENFKKLPPSSTGGRTVAALVEHISALRSLKQTERSAVDVDFHTLRVHSGLTQVAGRYETAGPLLNVILNHSKAEDLESNFENGSYALLFNNHDICKVQAAPTENTPAGQKLSGAGMQAIYSRFDPPTAKWNHGAADLAVTWTAVEDTFEDIMKMDLKLKPGANEDEVKLHQEKLKLFYGKAAQLVWLIGNTQPLKRGSGTVAEWLLAFVHMHHGLKPPVLKLEFPQLDVLDISFPLSDYKKMFTYFFEQGTLPAFMRRPDIPGSPREQIQQLYQ